MGISEVSKAATTMKFYLALVICSTLALQAVSMVDEDGCTTAGCPTCRDNGCGRLWQGKGECVNVTSVAFSKIEAEYDLRYSNAYYNKRCAPADSTSDKDCCLCLKKKPCVDKGCIEEGGMCVDMKNAQLGNANYGVRSEVDLDSPLGDGLCANDQGWTTAGPPKQCCTCYKKKEN